MRLTVSYNFLSLVIRPNKLVGNSAIIEEKMTAVRG